MFDRILKAEGMKPVILPICSPNLNGCAERWVQTLKHECLNHFTVFGPRHLNYLVREFVDYYHTQRSHQARDNLPTGYPPPEYADPTERWPSIDRASARPKTDKIVCESRLGGLLKH